MADVLSKLTTPWFSSNINERKDRTITTIVLMFLVLMISFPAAIGGTFQSIFTTHINTLILLILGTIAFAAMDKRPQIYASFGQDRGIMTGLLLGGFVGILLVYRFFAVTIPPMSGLAGGTILFAIYTALIVPFIEEKFFGGLLPFVLKQSIKNNIMVIVLTCLLFGAFHLWAYKANVSFMLSAVFFRFIIMLGNGYLQSSSFGFSLHYMNNILATIKTVV